MASEGEDEGGWLYGSEVDDLLADTGDRREELIKEFSDESLKGFAWWSEAFQHFRPPSEDEE